jgi:hypothetical protein
VDGGAAAVGGLGDGALTELRFWTDTSGVLSAPLGGTSLNRSEGDLGAGGGGAGRPTH